MSRKDVAGTGNYDLAFGVDTVTGAFVQLWKAPANDQDGALVVIDKFGVKQKEPVDKALLGFLAQVKDRFNQFHETNPNQFPNLDEQTIIDLARIAGGFSDELSMQVYEIFGMDI